MTYTAAMIQMNAQTIANIQSISNKIADLDKQIMYCQASRNDSEFKLGNISLYNLNTGSNNITLHAGNCAMLLDIMEIMYRKERDQLIEKLDELGIVLTDQSDHGRKPVWPAEPSYRHG